MGLAQASDWQSKASEREPALLNGKFCAVQHSAHAFTTCGRSIDPDGRERGFTRQVAAHRSHLIASNNRPMPTVVTFWAPRRAVSVKLRNNFV